MVNAAVDIQYGKDFYKEGTKLPQKLVKEFEERNPSLLSNYIQVNARWFKIDDPRIKGYVKEAKTRRKRLRAHFNVKENPVKEAEDRSHMLRSRPKKLTESDLQEKSFAELRKLGKKFGVKDRSRKKIIKEILDAQ